MPYILSFVKQATKQLEKIPEPFYSNIKQSILNLTENPRTMGHIKLKGRDGYRIRIGNYRVIYEIFEDRLLIEVITIGHRKDIYD